MKRTVGLHSARQTETARNAFRLLESEDAERRRAGEIGSLPTVIWKGATLHTVRCRGTIGRGPHDCHLPEAVLWALLDLKCYRCPYHPS